jgi:hypothetical protein
MLLLSASPAVGAICSFTPSSTSSSGSFVSASLVCVCPPSFDGPGCELAVLSCKDCVTFDAGGTEMTLIGVGLSNVFGTYKLPFPPDLHASVKVLLRVFMCAALHLSGIAGQLQVVPFELGNLTVSSSVEAQSALALP